jgi:hypothetical protein
MVSSLLSAGIGILCMKYNLFGFYLAELLGETKQKLAYCDD